MSNKNKYNSVVFLTTLCLGLVLVNVTPQVLTYAALTRNFDVQTEIEVKDDLDNKPDSEKIESFSNDDFPALFAQFLNEIREEVESGKISLPLQTNFNVNGQFTKSRSGGSSLGSNVSNQDLSIFIQNAVNQKSRPKAFDLADYDSQKTKNVKIRIEANGSDLSLKISFSKSNAEQFTEFLNREFFSSAVLVENALTKQIYENTLVTSENNQVFIITRLPRGSLDALFTNSAK